MADGIGAARARSEDQRLVTGRGTYANDFQPDDVCYAAFVRAEVAHAHIVGIDTDAAHQAPGVLGVYTGEHARADGLAPIPHNPDWKGPPDATLRMPDGFEVFLTKHYPLPFDTVRHVGEPVAMVIAETAVQAAEAAELIDVKLEPLGAVVAATDAMSEDAPQLWDGCPNNLALTCEVGDQEETDRAFAGAAHVVKLDTWVPRITGTPMEPRSVIGTFDKASQHYTLRAASGRGAVQTRERLATVLGVPLDKCRAVFGDMGGNFGTRNAFTPEFALLPWASSKVGRPVKWTATRNECFTTDFQARDTAFSAELALDAQGNFLAMRGVNTMNLGAYTVYFWPLRKGLSMMQGVYNLPCVYFQGNAVLTNTAPTAVYRSAGRPEAIYVIERLIDLAASRCGFDRVELRQRNLIRADEMPFENAVGVTYDSGDYLAGMREAISVSGWDGFAERRRQSAQRNRRRGIAVVNYIEVTSGIPRERAEIWVNPEGFIEMVVGTMSSGQGHETSFPQLLCEWLGVAHNEIRYVANDTDRVSVGGGSHSGRSMRLVSIAAYEAVEELLRTSKLIAAHLLQSEVDELTYDTGEFTAQSGASVSLYEVAKAAQSDTRLPEELRGPLHAIGDITNRVGGYPYGCHVCELEVDEFTGQIELVNWTCVDDVGRAVNPLILHGQAHGATTQGIGQAVMEFVHYESDSAQLLSGSFMDYAIPRALNTPAFKTVITEVPASSHPHGIRPGGEGGTTPALAAVVNAVVDALSDLGVEHVEMPTTPETVWRAIQRART